MNRSAFGLKLSQRRLGPPSTIQSLLSLPRRMAYDRRGGGRRLVFGIRPKAWCWPVFGRKGPPDSLRSIPGFYPVIKGRRLAKSNATGSEKTDVRESLNHSTARAGSGEGEWNNARGVRRRLEKALEILRSTPFPLAERQERLVRVSQGFQHNK